MKWVDGTDLVQWADRIDSRSLLPEVVRRLIMGTVETLQRIEFRSGEGVQQQGWDGYVETPTGNEKVPQGISCWELGASLDARTKANDDYATRTKTPLGVDPATATYFFVTPRRWAGKTAWAREKIATGTWRDVRVYDADDLEAWLMQAPAVGAWLARQIDKYPPHVHSLDDFWNEFINSTNPPLTDKLILAGRATEQERTTNWLRQPASILQVQADTTAEALAFVAACIVQLPQAEQDTQRSRTLLTGDVETLRALSVTRAPMTILYDGTTIAPTTIAVQRGHHVVIPMLPGHAPLANEVVLPHASRDAFTQALKAAGHSEEQAFALARETGQRISALQRRFAVARPVSPAWAQPPHVHDLIGMLFGGSWNDQRQADREILTELTGKPYDQVGTQATVWSQCEDPPLRRAGNIFAFTAVRDAWEQVGSFVTRDALQRFRTIAERVLSLDDPRLTLSPNERWLAGIRGQEPLHSSELREGLAKSLVFLSIFGEKNVIPHRAQDTASLVVRAVLAPGVAWTRWYSVTDVLRLLAEAAPEEFLSGLQAQLTPTAPDIVHLFNEEGGGFSHSKHTQLLWALESLAWYPTYLSPVTLLLGRLASLDPGGRLQNRPINSLRGIFLLWHPNTSATLSQRMQALDVLLAREQEVAWDLLAKLQPKSFDVGTVTAKPQWRDVMTVPRVTVGERFQGMTQLLDRTLILGDLDPDRLALLVKDCPSWPNASRERLVTQLDKFADATTSPEGRALVWAALRELVNNHRAHPKAEWVLPETAITPVARVQQRLEPTSAIDRYSWLFDDWWPNLGEARTDHTALEAALSRTRCDAIKDVLRADGHAGLIQLARSVKHPGFVGRDAAELIQQEAEQQALLLVTLASTNPPDRILARLLVTRWEERGGKDWVERMLRSPLTDAIERSTSFFLGLAFSRATWTRAAAFSKETEDSYWREAHVWLPQGSSLDDLCYALDHLVDGGRGFDALHLVSMHLELAPAALLIRILDAIRDLLMNAPTPVAQHFGFDLEHVFERLTTIASDPHAIARLEWFFLPLLNHMHQPRTLTLHHQLARDPALFEEVICAPHSQNGDEGSEASEQQAARARVAYELLSSWHILPGSRADGSIDATALAAWVDDARARFKARDREALGDQHIGQALSNAPTGADGIWPHPAVRDTIERLAARHLEAGITNGVYNGRGTCCKAPGEGGKQEREIAERYRKDANALAIKHPQTAGMLRRLAENYERDAQGEDIRAQQEDSE